MMKIRTLERGLAVCGWVRGGRTSCWRTRGRRGTSRARLFSSISDRTRGDGAGWGATEAEGEEETERYRVRGEAPVKGSL